MARRKMRRVCVHCLLELKWTRDRGWVHPGGGVYLQRCPCGWWGAYHPSHGHCPSCGSAGVHDDHYAIPA